MTTSRSAVVGAGASHLLRSYHAGLPDLRILRVREDVAGVRPRPSLRGDGRSHRPVHGNVALHGVRSRPSLRIPAAAHHDRLARRVAGVPPRPSLRDPAGHPHRRGDVGTLPGFVPGPRCAPPAPPTLSGEILALPGSAPALIARSTAACSTLMKSKALPGFRQALVAPSSRRPGARWTTRHRGTLPGFTSGPCCAWPMEDGTGSGQLGRCRGSAPALVARGSPRTRRSVASGRRCRGSAPALVARTRATTPTRSSPLRHCRGFGPPALVARRLADWGSRTEWAGRCRGSAPALVARSLRAPGRSTGSPRRCQVLSRPSLRAAPADLEPGGQRGVAGVRSRPSLREVRHHAPGGPRARRCRGSAPASLRGAVLRPADRRSPRGVAGVPPRPSLRDRMGRGPPARHGVALPGFRSGPRCAPPHLREFREGALPGFVSSKPPARSGASDGAACGGDGRRCRGSSPALVARRKAFRSWRISGRDVAGVRPRPLLRVLLPVHRPQAHRGVAGVRPRPSLRGPELVHHGPSAGRTLPGFGPGPRCASQPPPITTGSREALPGSHPGPRCAQFPQTWTQVDNAALPGFGPGPRCAAPETRRSVAMAAMAVTALPGFGHPSRAMRTPRPSRRTWPRIDNRAPPLRRAPGGRRGRRRTAKSR